MKAVISILVVLASLPTVGHAQVTRLARAGQILHEVDIGLRLNCATRAIEDFTTKLSTDHFKSVGVSPMRSWSALWNSFAPVPGNRRSLIVPTARFIVNCRMKSQDSCRLRNGRAKALRYQKRSG
jgi:hypothetical protein